MLPSAAKASAQGATKPSAMTLAFGAGAELQAVSTKPIRRLAVARVELDRILPSTLGYEKYDSSPSRSTPFVFVNEACAVNPARSVRFVRFGAQSP
jgi:hypothetical protein